MAIPLPSGAVDKASLIEAIQQLVPCGSPDSKALKNISLLKSLTADLIEAYLEEGGLRAHPYTETQERRIDIYKSEIQQQLKGKVVLVTGGEGCVGSYLIKKLIELGVKRLVSVDKARCHKSTKLQLINTNVANTSVKCYTADIRDYDALEQIFALEKPNIVFHLAAQRQPGLAEILIRETISTNIFGTQNVIQLCESYQVEQCIFSSTGKAYRYFTADVYAASKKIAEWLFVKAVQQGKVKYGMARFTHIIENSIVSQKIDRGIECGIVKLHAPDLYMFAQNNHEAVSLLLNALVFSDANCLKFLVVRNLGWVVDILELALFKILNSGKLIPIYFEGLPCGYNESFFRGLIDPSCTLEANALINAIESPFSTFERDIVVTKMHSFSFNVFETKLSALQTCVNDQDFPETELKSVLTQTVKEVACSIFLQVPPEKILRILSLGVNPKLLKLEKISIEVFQDLIEILVRGLYGRLNQEILSNAKLTERDFQGTLDVLSSLPQINHEVAYLREFTQKISSSNL
jgi:NADP-dependent 3-hydroxy acid dehydrogenase YdfG